MTAASTAGAHGADGETAVPAQARGLLSALPDAAALVEWNPHESAPARLAWANAAATVLTGRPLEELRRLGPEAIVGELLGPAAPMEVRGALRDRDAARAASRITRADGTHRWVDVSLGRAPGGPVPTWVVVCRDAAYGADTESRLRYEADERARVGLGVVLRVSGLLAELDADRVLPAIIDLLVRRIVPWCGFFALGRELYEVRSLDLGPDVRRRRPEGLVPCEISALFDEDMAGVYASGTMRTVAVDLDAQYPEGSLSRELVALVAPQLEAHRGLSRTLTVLPVLGRTGTLAILAALNDAEAPQPPPLSDSPERHETVLHGMAEQDVGTVLELVARRVGMAMENAQLYNREHLLAETLQRSMLPEQDDVQGLDVWSYYAPTSDHAQVGGDWYDVVNLTESTVAVVVGDVTGHDVEAAAAMGQLRSVVRAYAAELVDPATVLRRVDRLVGSMRIPRSASLVYATLTRHPDGHWDVAYHRAGHLPPLLRRGAEVRTLDERGGTLIGFAGRERETAHVRAEPGDVLVFYTDGLVERRDRPMREGIAALRQLCSEVDAPDAAGVGEELLQLADKPEDDVALVVVSIPGRNRGLRGGRPSPRQRRWQLPSDPATIARARRAVSRACDAWGIAEAPATELVVSELVANAVLHGWGRVGLRVQDTGDGLRIEVEDGNPAPPVAREHVPGRVGGFGIHIVDRLADWGWRPTAGGKVVWARLRPGAGAHELGVRSVP